MRGARWNCNRVFRWTIPGTPLNLRRMTTHRTIVDALARAAIEGESIVLATVVQVTGSSYGGVGSRMVIRVDGSTIGIVSGGCLETDLADKARNVSESKVPEVVTYDTRADDDAAWGLGLGCNGLIDVLLEPLSPAEAGALGDLLDSALESTTPSLMATVVKSTDDDEIVVGAHALIRDGTVETVGNWGASGVLQHVASDQQEAMSAGRRGMLRDYDGTQVAFEIITPAVRLVICGSGPDVVPLVRFGSELGWTMMVVDHRPVEHAHPERFPGARVVECGDPAYLANAIDLTSGTAAVVMSHHYARDLEYVRSLLGSRVAYIGVLGPRARAERMLADVTALGGIVERGDRLFAPVGLDIGSEGPDAIALSIIAEVAATLHRRSGGHLRDRVGPLHASDDVSPATRS
jgi:xanthine/CO dehydrogenase XdhC/CoxF family maturation factor